MKVLPVEAMLMFERFPELRNGYICVEGAQRCEHEKRARESNVLKTRRAGTSLEEGNWSLRTGN